MIYYTENFNCSCPGQLVNIPWEYDALFFTQTNHFSKVLCQMAWSKQQWKILSPFWYPFLQNFQWNHFKNTTENPYTLVCSRHFSLFLIAVCSSCGMSHEIIQNLKLPPGDSKSNLPRDSGEYHASGKKRRVRTSYRVLFAEKYYRHVLLIEHFDWTS